MNPETTIGLRRVKILRPLAIRDFALLWTGAAVSLLGDGVYIVAIAWQVYEISDTPTALSLIGVAWTLPMAAFLLVGGVVSDRFDRQRIMIATDIVRAVAVTVIAVLSLAGVLELWHLFLLAIVFGTGDAFFGPAFNATVPQIVPQRLLVQANSLDQFIRPFMMALAGPALGGLTVAALGAGAAFALDAGSFFLSALAISLMSSGHRVDRSEEKMGSALNDLREAFSFVRQHAWLWGTLLGAAISLLAFWGPIEVLVPYRIKNDLGGDAADFGLVLAAGGVGAILAAVVMAQAGLPRKHMTFMYVAWAIGCLGIAGLAFATVLWQAMASSFVQQALFASGLIVWGTLMQTLVPSRLLGRVTSLDWLVSTSLVPISFALTGPVAAAVGAEATLAGAGVIACAATLLCLLIPGMRDTERGEHLAVLAEERS
ncbi:MAG TPA: MFS transporter [Gaiellaceae bacterium]|nr:MFS transporter [Gaiellaceae bacterium]